MGAIDRPTKENHSVCTKNISPAGGQFVGTARSLYGQLQVTCIALHALTITQHDSKPFDHEIHVLPNAEIGPCARRRQAWAHSDIYYELPELDQWSRALRASETAAPGHSNYK